MSTRTAACWSASGPEGKSLAGLWEFPGGKVEAGEAPEAALIRELGEELGIAVSADCLAPLTFASHSYPEMHLLMPLWVCRRWQGIVAPREGQALRWLRARELRNLAMPPADAPLIACAGGSAGVDVCCSRPPIEDYCPTLKEGESDERLHASSAPDFMLTL